MPTSMELELPVEEAVETPTWVGDVFIVSGVVLATTVGGWVTTEAVTTWYPTLTKPTFTPPEWLFGPVWTVLYIMMVGAAALVWRRRTERRVTLALSLFGGQLVLNLMWSVLFFGLRSPLLGLIDIAALWLLIGATATAFARVRPAAGWLLVPYWLWVSFAAVLNAAIWWMN